MKTIGILTFHYVDNCGAILQLLALKDFFNNLGYEIIVLDYQSKKLKQSNAIIVNPFYKYSQIFNNKQLSLYQKNILFCKSIINNCILNLYFARRIRLHSKFKKFHKKFLMTDLSEKVENIYDLENLSEELYAIVVGSDQVWNIDLLGGKTDPIYFLQTSNIASRKVSYAGSSGGLIEKSVSEINQLFRQFDYISSREIGLTEQIKGAGYEAETVCDPVFLLSKVQWEKYIERNSYGQYILVYALENNSELTDIVEKINWLYGQGKLQILELGYRKRCKISSLVTVYDPATFISLVYNARVVITNSFHATAFSVIFHVPFYTIIHSKRNMRMENLLHLVGYHDRMISTSDDIDNKILKQNEISDKFEEFITASKAFLHKSLEE